MRIGLFTITVVSLLILFAILNGFWISRLINPALRNKFRLTYGVLTLLGASAYLSVRVIGQNDGLFLFNFLYYLGPFWTVLQLLLLLSWPFSKIAATLQKRWGVQQDDVIVAPTENRSARLSMSRRVFLSHAAMLPPVAMTGINAVGVLGAEFRTVLRRIDFAYDNLPKNLDGLKIGHLTDAHIGPYVSARDVEKMANLLKQDSPDLLAITGDFADDLSLLPDALDRMKPLLASLPLGAWFCMGNHEYLRGAESIRQVLQKYGIHILDNRHQRLPFGGAHFLIVGVDYPMGASLTTRPAAVRNYLESACSNIKQTDFTVLLAHHPDFLPAAFERHIGLTLSGHTHGGQVGWGQRSAFQILYPYMRGVYQENQSFGFVSSGAGHWIPFRLNCPPEVCVLTLKRKA